MIITVLENLHQKTYRLETIVTEQRNPVYAVTKSYARQIEIYYIGKAGEEHLFQILVVDFDFSDNDTAMGRLIKRSVICLTNWNAGLIMKAILQQ